MSPARFHRRDRPVARMPIRRCRAPLVSRRRYLPLNIVVVELIFVAVVALGLGLWQLWDVNRELRKDRERDESEDDPDAGAD